MTNILKFTDASSIKIEELQQFLRAGFCFIKLPDDILNALNRIRTTALEFFHLPEEEKSPYVYDQRNGYLNQAIKTKTNVQRYIYRDKIVAPDFSVVSNDFEQVKQYYAEHIFQPIAKNIFTLLGIEQHLAEFFNEPDQTLSSIYYPNMPNNQERLVAHKDAVALTALWAPQAGLEAKIDEKWQMLEPHSDAIALNFGEAFELATGKHGKAIEHRVSLNCDTERFSLASFYGPNHQLIFTDYINNQVINPVYGDYVQDHLAKVYEKVDR